ncbi:chemotaxis protein CheW [Litoribrevibacter euphylliae]|uniref:Chemotaxis protein CheW n=1 Tax=Litoribrevibacter euphylliae TaxID=1834034 RepID=A0ABV7HB10_9GAMM
MHSNEALPEELLKERAKLYLAETEQESKQLLGYLLIFRLDNQWFGLPTSNIHETTHLKNGVVLPRVQTGVLGLIQQHSGFIPLIDLHYLLHLPSIKVTPNQSQKLVVMEGDNGNYGFLVNELSTVEAIYESYLVSQEESIEEKSTQMIKCLLEFPIKGSPRKIIWLKEDVLSELVEAEL